jgi:arylsulfatase A-like enzyme
MKVIMVMFDSLNRHLLPPYGCDWTHAPNFKRLAESAVTFDKCYVGSMPCMPARRELHTGRYNFLHRSWGPIEPFDDSMPEILKNNGVYTHLVSDHTHYWEDGGATYHTRYNTWEISRGQETDSWKGEVAFPEIPEHIGQDAQASLKQHWINKKYIQNEKDQPQAVTFARGIEFIKTNHKEDDWFLQIETFDPHEPFFTSHKYKDFYPHEYNGPHFDWPKYHKVIETRDQIQHCRYEYAALLSMCDEYLGKVLDEMDEYDLWKDTMLIVNTDHGYLLGEHDWWGKNASPLYNEIANTPFFIWDPRTKITGERRDSLVQTIDIAPTILDYFNIKIPENMQGKPLREVISHDKPIREAALYGAFGGHLNCTDGRYVYMRAPANQKNEPLNEYTLMPTHMRKRFTVEELSDINLQQPFKFTKGCRTMRIKRRTGVKAFQRGTALYDLETDPKQENPIVDPEVEEKMIGHIVKLMKENDAPIEQYERLGLKPERQGD